MKPLYISKQITSRESISLNKYLGDISRIPLISQEEEVDLTVRIKDGDQAALEKLVSANLRFVVSVAKQYQSRGLNLHDLINEGNLGLIKAAQKFDETRGFKFISYAVWWIRQGIIQAITEKSRMVRLPLNKINAINKINSYSSHFEQQFQRVPTADELSEMVDFSLPEIEFCINHSSRARSLDEHLKPGESTLNLHDVMPSKALRGPEQTMNNYSLQQDLDEVLHLLTFREAYILKRFYGIGIDNPVGLAEIAIELSLTSERVRQIKLNALDQLRNSVNIDLLKEYL